MSHVKLCSRLVALLIVFSISAQTVFANVTDEQLEGVQVFNFSAPKYVVSVGDGEYGVTVKREANSDQATTVLYKVVPVTAMYGKDFAVLDENGERMALNNAELESTIQKGEIVDPENMTPLEKAQSQFLQIDNKQMSATAVEDILTEAREYFVNADGVVGTLVFQPGEMEKQIRVEIIDYGVPKADQQVAFSLMAADNDGQLPPNPTAVMNIVDNKPYEVPLIGIEGGDFSVDTSSEKLAKVKLVRTQGINYYTAVKFSTYGITAVGDIDYTIIDEKIPFLPGETEKTAEVPVSLVDSPREFGITISDDGSCDVTNDRVVVTLLPEKTAEVDQISPMLAEVEIQSTDTAIGPFANASIQPFANVTAGSPTLNVPADFNGIKDGASKGRQDGYSDIVKKSEGTFRRIRETFMYDGRSMYAGPYDLRDAISLSMHIYNDGDHGGSYGAFNSRVDIRDYALGWSTNSLWKKVSNFNLKDHIVNIPDGYNIKNGYIHFTTWNADGNGDSWSEDNTRFAVGNLKVNYKKFTFDITTLTATNFYRYEYDYTQKDKRKLIEFDVGEGVKAKKILDFQPGGIQVLDSSGNNVTAAYTNGSPRIKIVPTPNEENDRYGIEFKGVYVVKNNVSSSQVNSSNSKFLSADEIKSFYFTSDFMDKIRNYVGSDGKIRLKPVYERRTTKVTIGTDKNSTIISMNPGLVKDYTFYVGDKIVFNSYATGGNMVDHLEIIHTPGGSAIEKNVKPPFERFEYIIPNSPEIKVTPRTSPNSLTVRVNPLQSKGLALPEGTDNYAGVVASLDIDDKLISDAKGILKIPNVSSGKIFSFTAMPPKGFTTVWLNGTGDTDGNGHIDNEEHAGRSEDDYLTIMGNILSVKIKEQSPLYYYKFNPVYPNPITKKGILYQDLTTIYDAINQRSLRYKKQPVFNASINMAGRVCYTDADGRFSLYIDDVPIEGTFYSVISTNGFDYIVPQKMNFHGDITLPTYNIFKPKSLSASPTSIMSQNVVSITDTNFTISVGAENNSGQVVKGANFYIYDSKGELKNTFANRSVSAGVVSFDFNLKSEVKFGDKIFVEFYDQNGLKDRQIDLGYEFIEPLDLKTFVFSSFGWNGAAASVESLGIPFLDMNLGSISGFTTQTKSGLGDPEQKDPKYLYNGITYKFGDPSQISKIFPKNEFTKQPLQGGFIKESNVKLGNKASLKLSAGGNFDIGFRYGFEMTLTTRNMNGKQMHCFEDLMFMLGAHADIGTQFKIALPLGISVIVQVGVEGEILGVYKLYTTYFNDRSWSKNYVEYSPTTFSLFEGDEKTESMGLIYLDIVLKLNASLKFLVMSIGVKNEFKFNMEFGFFEGQSGSAGKGTMTYTLSMNVKTLSFVVYNRELAQTTVKLFDYGDSGKIPVSPLKAANAVLAQNQPVDVSLSPRDYLSNSSNWNGSAPMFRTFSTDANFEHQIKSGLYPEAEVKLASLSADNKIMVFIDDDPERTAINRGTIYYSLYDGLSWSNPKQLDPDGTLDSYIDISDLGDKLAITWSSAEKLLEENATVQEALHSLNIKCLIIDKDNPDFSQENITQLTKKTTEDYGANLRATIAYDTENPDNLIAFYTKTEFKEVEATKDLLGKYSVVAYRYFDGTNWNDGSDYTDDELTSIADKQAYRDNWYGQRFLDVRLSKAEKEVPLVYDSGSVISYNGLALFAYVIDYDNDLDTTDDKDMLVQVYNFNENSFSHIIRISKDSGAYGKPQFARHGDNTYLFYTSNRIDITDDQGNIEQDQTGIQYVNITDIIKNNYYESNSAGYYNLVTSRTEVDSETGEQVLLDMEFIASILADGETCVTDYTVEVSDDDKMYLLWVTGDTIFKDGLPEDGSLPDVSSTSLEYHIYGAMWNGMSQEPIKDQPMEEESIALGFGDKVKLTSGEDTCYKLYDAFIKDGKVNIAVAKSGATINGDSKIPDENNMALIMLEHTPFTQLSVAEDDIVTENYYHVQREQVTVFVNNNGLKPSMGETEVSLTLVQNGTETPIGTKTVESILGGGVSRALFVLPEFEVPQEAELKAEITNNGETITTTKTLPYQYDITNSLCEAGFIGDGKSKFLFEFTNEGNKKAENLTLKLYANDTLLSEEPLQEAMPLETVMVATEFELEESLLELEDAVGTCQVEFRIYDGDVLHKTFSSSYTRHYDPLAIEKNNKVQSLSAPSTMKVIAGESQNLNCSLAQTDEENIIKYKSSDNTIAVVDSDGNVSGLKEGNVEIIAYSIPLVEYLTVTPAMDTEQTDTREKFPESQLKQATIAVTIEAAKTPTPTTRPNNSGNYASSSIGGVYAMPTKAEVSLPTEWKDTAEFTNGFNDISNDAWYYDDVAFVAANSLFNGISETEFAPNDKMSRAMLVTVLHRLAGTPIVNTEKSFGDVTKGEWYAQAVAWAVENGITLGISETEFAPNRDITREQTATFLERFIKYAGITLPQTRGQQVFIDQSEVSDYAINAIELLNQLEIINGVDDTGEGVVIAPKEGATRAQLAAMIHRICKKIAPN